MNFISLKSTNYIQLVVAYFISCLFLAITYVWLIHFYVKGWLKTPNQNTNLTLNPEIGVSIVVSIRNEEDNIEECLSSILSQDYPKELLEIIVVNDFSTDHTLKVLEKFQSKVSVIKLSEHLSPDYAVLANKKRAITLAVNRAKFDLVLCGDGDCIYGHLWVKSMLQYYTKYRKQFISGPVDYIDSDGFWKSFLFMDLAAMIGVTAGSIGQKKPVMASGANMFFEKQAFLEVNGYESNENIASGDDVFLMQKLFLRNEKSVGFVKNVNAIAKTHSPQTFKEFIHQRIRWTSKSSNLLDKKVKLVLILNYFFYLACFLSLFILPFWDIAFLGFGVLLLLFKILIDLLFFGNILAFYDKKRLLKWILPLELLHIIYVSFTGVLAIFGSYQWKGRKIKK